MRICPQCGYKETPIWRNTLRRLYTEYCHIGELEAFEPDLANILKEKKFVSINGIKYKLNKSGTHVHRIPAYLCAHPEPNDQRILEPDKETHKCKFIPWPPNQKKLLETQT